MAHSVQGAGSIHGTPSVWGGIEFDPRVHDSAFLEEIDLYSELMIVAASSVGALSADAIDQALGLVTVIAVPDDHRITILAG